MELNFNLNIKKEQKHSLSPEHLYDVLVIGGGPAGLNASLYVKRKGLSVGIITKKIGGQIVNTSQVDNYLGYPDIEGQELIDRFLEHINQLSIPILDEVEVTDINSNNNLHHVLLSIGETYKAKTIIIATGSKPRRLNISGEKKFLGKGVAYCAICDAPLFQNKDVIIAGGGNSAVEAALDLVKVAKNVTLVHRSHFRADKILLKQLQKEKIDIHLKTKIIEVVGERAMTGIKIEKDGKIDTIHADGLFIEIGHIPNNQFNLRSNNHNEIIVDQHNRTNIPGVFACGDVTNTTYKQIIIAASEGAKAALSANDYLNQGLHN